MKHFPVGHGTKYNTYLHGTASNPTEEHTKDMMLDFCIKLLIAQPFLVYAKSEETSDWNFFFL
jgi:hypothetical protein